VVEALLGDHPLYRLQSVQAILRLEKQMGSQRLEATCGRALHFEDPTYKRIKRILNAGADKDPIPEAVPELPSKRHEFARSGEEFFGRKEAA